MAARSLLCVLAFLLSACSGTPPTQQEVEKFVREYLSEANAAKSMSFVSQDPGVSSIVSGKIFQGWKTIRALQEENSGDELKVKVGTMDVTAIGSDTALAVAPIKVGPYLQIGRVITLEAAGAITIIVKRTPEGLRVIHEHYSLQPI
jgi:hypothetical protein